MIPEVDSRSNRYSWDRRNIFKAFCIREIYDEAVKNGATPGRRATYDEINSTVRVLLITDKYKKYLSYPEWREAVERAKKIGMDFAGTPYNYVEPQA